MYWIIFGIAKLVLSREEFARRERRYLVGWGFRFCGRDWFTPPDSHVDCTGCDECEE